MKVIVTKYALTQGLFEIDGEFDGDLVVQNPKNPAAGLILRNGSDCFFWRPDAEEHARDMAKRKIGSLKRQLAALEKLAKEPKWRKA